MDSKQVRYDLHIRRGSSVRVRDSLAGGHVLRSWMCFHSRFPRTGRKVETWTRVMELQNMCKRCCRCYHVVIDGNLCSNLGVSQGRLSNIYYKC